MRQGPYQLLPPADVLSTRLALIDTELGLIEARLLEPELPAAQRAGALAHQAQLLNRRRWYLARIRRTRPVQTLGVSVDDPVGLHEST